MIRCSATLCLAGTSSRMLCHFANMFVWWCLYVFLSQELMYCNGDPTISVFGRIQNGLKLAGKLLGLDKATEVAQLVTESFGKPQRKGDEGGINIFSKFLKLLGLESKKISAIAVNAIVFLAQLISTTLSRPGPPILTRQRNAPNGQPLDWILQNPNKNIKDLIDAAKDPSLPDKVIEYLDEKPQDTSCIQLLICKTSPFLWGMQKALTETAPEKSTNRLALMFHYLPTYKEVSNFGDHCESRFPDCILK